MSRIAGNRRSNVRRALLVAALVTAAGTAAGAGDPGKEGAPGPRRGFFAGSRDAERKGERGMLAAPTPERARSWLRGLTEGPPGAGNAQGKRVAESGVQPVGGERVSG